MHCATVGLNGIVTITWDETGTSPLNFGSWYTYHSTNANGPFTAIDSVFFYTDTTYTHATANAANNPAYYYAVFKPNDGSPDIVSDTIRAVGLNLNNPGNGYANLSWNATKYPLIPTTNPYYLIYREYPPGIFTIIDSIDVRTAPIPMTYSDVVTICDDTLKYKIEVRDSSGCSSFSSVRGDRFVDRIAPSIPVIDSVSVDIAGNAIVSWIVNPSSDTRSYVILHNPGHVVIDTVYGLNTTTLNTVISAMSGSESFEVLAIDSCNNPTAPSLSHSTIYLTASFDLCSASGILGWTPYNFWGVSPLYYIYTSVNGGVETLIDSTANTFYIDTNLISGASFCYRIRAAETGGIRTTTSNRKCILPSFPPPPSFSYIRKVTVAGTDRILVVAYVDPAANIKGYTLLRSDNPGGPFSSVASVNVNGVSTVSFNDNVATDRRPYYYMVSTIDSCGNTVKNSQISHSILLTGISNPELFNDLAWNDYGNWPTGVSRYNIYRSVNGVVISIPIATVLFGDNTYLDSVLESFFSNGEFCYVVEAVESPGNPYFFLDSSRSNEICLKQEPIIFIPNAFHPGGVFNTYWYPSNSFVSAKDYTLDIYNRWGENIFHTADPREGWNGTRNGNSVQEGVYIYRLKAKTPGGTDIERVGSVTLIR